MLRFHIYACHQKMHKTKVIIPLFSQTLRLKRRRFFSDKDLRLNETRSIVTLCENRVQE